MEKEHLPVDSRIETTVSLKGGFMTMIPGVKGTIVKWTRKKHKGSRPPEGCILAEMDNGSLTELEPSWYQEIEE